MDYKFWLFMVIAFFIGRLSKLKLYIGPDNEKYKKADYGILMESRKRR